MAAPAPISCSAPGEDSQWLNGLLAPLSSVIAELVEKAAAAAGPSHRGAASATEYDESVSDHSRREVENLSTTLFRLAEKYAATRNGLTVEFRRLGETCRCQRQELLEARLAQVGLKGESRRLQRILRQSYVNDMPAITSVIPTTSSRIGQSASSMGRRRRLRVNHHVLDEQLSVYLLHDYSSWRVSFNEVEKHRSTHEYLQDRLSSLNERDLPAVSAAFQARLHANAEELEIVKAELSEVRIHGAQFNAVREKRLKRRLRGVRKARKALQSQYKKETLDLKASIGDLEVQLASTKLELERASTKYDDFRHVWGKDEGVGLRRGSSGIPVPQTSSLSDDDLRSTPAPLPVERSVAIVMCDIEDSALYWQSNLEVMANAVVAYNETIRRVARAIGTAYEVKNHGGRFVFAFPCLSDAMSFCVQAQHSLASDCEWPQEMLTDPEFMKLHVVHAPVTAEQQRQGAADFLRVLWRGLRVMMSLHVGKAPELLARWNPVVKRFDYIGVTAHDAEVFLSLARGGEICLLQSVWEELLLERPEYAIVPAVKKGVGPGKESVSSWRRGLFHIGGIAKPVVVRSVLPWLLRERILSPLAEGEKFRWIGLSFSPVPTNEIAGDVSEDSEDTGRLERLQNVVRKEHPALVFSEIEGGQIATLLSSLLKECRETLSSMLLQRSSSSSSSGRPLENSSLVRQVKKIESDLKCVQGAFQNGRGVRNAAAASHQPGGSQSGLLNALYDRLLLRATQGRKGRGGGVLLSRPRQPNAKKERNSSPLWTNSRGSELPPLGIPPPAAASSESESGGVDSWVGFSDSFRSEQAPLSARSLPGGFRETPLAQQKTNDRSVDRSRRPSDDLARSARSRRLLQNHAVEYDGSRRSLQDPRKFDVSLRQKSRGASFLSKAPRKKKKLQSFVLTGSPSLFGPKRRGGKTRASLGAGRRNTDTVRLPMLRRGGFAGFASRAQ